MTQNKLEQEEVKIVKFKRLHRWQTYPAWVSIRKHKKCKIYIFQLPDIKKYHYHVICEDKELYYASLNYGILFDTFEKCRVDIERWIKDNC